MNSLETLQRLNKPLICKEIAILIPIKHKKEKNRETKNSMRNGIC